MNTCKTFLLLIFFISVIGCKEDTKNRKNLLEESPVVGKRIKSNTGELISVNQSLLKDTIRMPLSSIAEELTVVALDNHEDALIGYSKPVISDNYILVYNQRQNPFKLFHKNGKFISSIGSYGNGPNEYTLIYDAQIDEENKRIYLLPWTTDYILCYDLDGNTLPPIPLHRKVSKGKIKVLPGSKNIAVTTLPFPENEPMAWVQDEFGNVMQSVLPGHLSLPWSYDNELYSNRNNRDFEISLYTLTPASRADTLYHFDMQKGELLPRFTFNFKEYPLPWHAYYELTDYYYGHFCYPIKLDEEIEVNSPFEYYIVDKKSLKGAYAVFVNDYWGGLGIPPHFENGYFVRNFEPENLIDTLEEALANKELPDKTREELTILKNSINRNNNNYIVYAKLR